ncbi:hypothetical protein HanPSC8_Chr11g0495201 [Helianthus annuus]|nr:hypothetical protein HanPSC8_Chr11g0495201 [Helianthus annuus]
MINATIAPSIVANKHIQADTASSSGYDFSNHEARPTETSDYDHKSALEGVL